MKIIKEVLNGIYENHELRKTVIPLFIGNPGVSKTVQIEEFAKEKKAHLVTLIASQISPMEVSGLMMPNKDYQTIEYYDSEPLLSLKDGSILFLDEILNGSPVVLSAMLTLLTSRVMISGKPLPDIMIIAAANPQGQAPLTPAIKERFVWYNIDFDPEMWIDYMTKKYEITSTIGKKLSALIQKEDFINNNFNTPRSIDKAVNCIINNVPTPYTERVLPILSEIVKNELDGDVKYQNEVVLEKNESIMWIDLIKRKNEIIRKQKI